MKKYELPSDTVFEHDLNEILSCDSIAETDNNSRHRLNFPESFDQKKRTKIISELFIRVLASIAALGLLIYLITHISSKL